MFRYFLYFVVFAGALALPAQNSVEYSDDFARKQMFNYAAACYAQVVQDCITQVDATVRRVVEEKCDILSDTCMGYTAVSEKNKAIIVSYRGTTEVEQLLAEAGGSLFEQKVKFLNNTLVNAYFYNGFEVLWSGGMKYDFLALAAKYKPLGYELWVTGHSLGGAMAALAANYIAGIGAYPTDKIKLLTFGQPRTGDSAFANYHDRLLPNAIRVTHAHDAVPHIPFTSLGYQHHHSEVWYQSSMKPGSSYKVCKDAEDSSCSDGNFANLSVTDHFHYFDVEIVTYASNGCR